MFLRPCFLVVDREFASSISSRKLVLETAKFNVITAYSYPEAEATLQLFPNMQACVVSAHPDGRAEELLRYVHATYPQMKRVLTGRMIDPTTPVDLHVESYSPDALLQGIRKLFPADSERAEQIEQQLEDSTTA